MDEKLEEKLFEKYPVLLRGRNKSVRDNLLPFGVACESGWYDLLDDLLADLKEINKDLDYDIEVTQIKQKFGLLRFYLNGAPKEAHERIHKAEEESSNICEKCGTRKNVTTNEAGWIQTLCDECREKQKKEKLDTINDV